MGQKEVYYLQENVHLATKITWIPATGLMLTRIAALNRMFLNILDLCFVAPPFASTPDWRTM